jgi:hypothetical protein
LETARERSQTYDLKGKEKRIRSRGTHPNIEMPNERLRAEHEDLSFETKKKDKKEENTI